MIIATSKNYLVKIADLEPGDFVWFKRDRLTDEDVCRAVEKQFPGRVDLHVNSHGSSVYVDRLMEPS